MEKEFVPYELAVKLKALGFNEKCLAYHKDNELYQEAGVCYVKSDFQPTIVWDEMLQNKNCTAILYQQAFRWFREKYKLHTEIRSYTVKYFTIIIQECKDIVRYIEYGGIDLKFNTYEEAELACLEKLIEIVKNK